MNIVLYSPWNLHQIPLFIRWISRLPSSSLQRIAWLHLHIPDIPETTYRNLVLTLGNIFPPEQIFIHQHHLSCADLNVGWHIPRWDSPDSPATCTPRKVISVSLHSPISVFHLQNALHTTFRKNGTTLSHAILSPFEEPLSHPPRKHLCLWRYVSWWTSVRTLQQLGISPVLLGGWTLPLLNSYRPSLVTTTCLVAIRGTLWNFVSTIEDIMSFWTILFPDKKISA